MASLGPNESDKNEVGLSHVLQEYLLLEARQLRPVRVWLCISTWALPWHGIRCCICKGKQKNPSLFCQKETKLEWDNLQSENPSKNSPFPDKVKSPSTLLLSLASPSAQIWHNLNWVHRSSLSFPCYQRLIYGSASGWEEAPYSLEEFPTLLWNGEVSACSVSLPPPSCTTEIFSRRICFVIPP